MAAKPEVLITSARHIITGTTSAFQRSKAEMGLQS